MKKSITKLFALIFSAIICAGVMTGCGETVGDSGVPETETSEKAEQPNTEKTETKSDSDNNAKAETESKSE